MFGTQKSTATAEIPAIPSLNSLLAPVISMRLSAIIHIIAVAPIARVKGAF